MVCHKPKYGRTTLLVTPPEALFDEKLAISIDVCCLVAWAVVGSKLYTKMEEVYPGTLLRRCTIHVY